MNSKPTSPRPRSIQQQAGFSLIEVLIVLVVIGIIAAIALVALLNALDKSKQRATMGDMRTISKGIEVYQIDLGFYPVGPLTMPALKNLLIPYQTSTLPERDHWNHEYSYTSPITTEYSVESFGKDGVDGTDISPATRWQFERDIVINNGVFTAAPEQ